MDDAELIRRFVESFIKYDEMTIVPREHPPNELSDGVTFDKFGFSTWCPVAIATPEAALEAIRSRIDGTLPNLYEQLVLSYRWLEVDLRDCCLLANEPADDLSPLLKQMFGDRVLAATLLPARLVPFARAIDCYDPVCFDINRYREGDCPIVRVEHESVLCNDKIGGTEVLFGSFRALMMSVVHSAPSSHNGH